ncbi:hypothetical protein ACWD3J_41780 [Streptomyces sp. NPDC002755]
MLPVEGGAAAADSVVDLPLIDGQDETITELEMIVGFDDGLAREAPRGENRRPRADAAPNRYSCQASPTQV